MSQKMDETQHLPPIFMSESWCYSSQLADVALCNQHLIHEVNPPVRLSLSPSRHWQVMLTCLWTVTWPLAMIWYTKAEVLVTETVDFPSHFLSFHSSGMHSYRNKSKLSKCSFFSYDKNSSKLFFSVYCNILFCLQKWDHNNYLSKYFPQHTSITQIFFFTNLFYSFWQMQRFPLYYCMP